MALGSLLLSMPFALVSALWLHLLKGWPAVEALAVYSALGASTLLVIWIALTLAKLRAL